MKTSHKILAVAGAILLSGCASTYPDSSYSNPQPDYRSSNSPQYASAYGVIDAIDTVQTNGNSTSSPIGVGTVIGGVVGGVLGNQIGGGTGKTIATAAGVVGGAVVGHQIEKSRSTSNQYTYRIKVRMDNGSYASYTQNNIGDMRPGDRVRIDNGQVTRY
jgi:outer membrane lipoprotein SlyB